MFGKSFIKCSIAIVVANYLVAVFPQAARSQTTQDCARIYNSDTSSWSIDSRNAYNARRKDCYNKAIGQLSSTNNYSIRQRNLRKAMVRVQNDFFRRNGNFIEVNPNNVAEMMRNIGATPAERQFVTEQMSLYS
jgi:hypothetical protein